VKRNYRQLQNLIHPDRYASTPKVKNKKKNTCYKRFPIFSFQEAFAANLSALISSCYSIITDSLRWAFVMLEHYSQEGFVKSLHDAPLHVALLNEVFEVNRTDFIYTQVFVLNKKAFFKNVLF
jgi:hypothetical protein